MNKNTFRKQITDIVSQLDGSTLDFDDFASAAEMGIGWSLALAAVAARDDHQSADDTVELLSEFLLETDAHSDQDTVKMALDAFRAWLILGPLAAHTTMPVLRHCVQLKGNGCLRGMATELMWRITGNSELVMPVVEELLGDED